MSICDAGMWEFPGGKVMQHEAAEQGLLREVKEEVGVTLQYKHTYPATFVFRKVTPYPMMFLLFWSDHFSGEARGCEGQDVRWLSLAELGTNQFPLLKNQHSFLAWLRANLDAHGQLDAGNGG